MWGLVCSRHLMKLKWPLLREISGFQPMLIVYFRSCVKGRRQMSIRSLATLKRYQPFTKGMTLCSTLPLVRWRGWQFSTWYCIEFFLGSKGYRATDGVVHSKRCYGPSMTLFFDRWEMQRTGCLVLSRHFPNFAKCWWPMLTLLRESVRWWLKAPPKSW